MNISYYESLQLRNVLTFALLTANNDNVKTSIDILLKHTLLYDYSTAIHISEHDNVVRYNFELIYTHLKNTNELIRALYNIDCIFDAERELESELLQYD